MEIKYTNSTIVSEFPCNIPSHHTIVCSQRPLSGAITWEGSSLGNGIYYAAGDINEYQKAWSFLDASIVKILSNDEILDRVKTELTKRNFTLDKALQRMDMHTICNSFKLPSIA